MNKKKVRMIGISLIIASLVIISVFAVANYLGNKLDTGSGRTKFQCVVSLDSDVLSNTDIESVECDVVGQCSWLTTGLMFGWFEDEGIIKFVGDDGTTYARTNYKISDLSIKNEQFTLKGCTDTLKGEIVVESKENGRQDSKPVVLG